MIIQLKFEDESKVSQESEWDTVNIEFMEFMTLVNEFMGLEMSSNSTISSKIPP